MQTGHYFMLNKQGEFERGWGQNVVWRDGALTIQAPERGGGIFFSRVLDSHEKETRWHRVRLTAHSLGDFSLRFTFYSSDSRLVLGESGEEALDAVITDPERSVEEKRRCFEPYHVKTIENPRDALLHESKGRYLWFVAELFGQGEESPRIAKIRIDFPKRTWMEYLPELYQSPAEAGSFTERYLSLFQSLYDDLEENIQRLPASFDPDVVSGPFLQWLASWLDVADSYVWSEEKLRYLLQHGMEFYTWRGTRRGVFQMVELFTGEPPYIVEQHELRMVREDLTQRRRLDRLYGENSALFTVVVRSEVVPDPIAYRTLLKVIDNARPAHTEANVVVLRPYIFLDKYSYLGMNSVLGQYRPVNLDGFSALPFTGLMEQKG